MCLGPCGPCTSLYSYPLGLAWGMNQLSLTWYQARVYSRVSSLPPLQPPPSYPAAATAQAGRADAAVAPLPQARRAAAAPLQRVPSRRLSSRHAEPPLQPVRRAAAAPLLSPAEPPL
jgi:hypothetical protein